jgi:hypothetical protein
VFLAFAFAYFLSALLRAITATLSPTLTPEFSAAGARPGFARRRLLSWALPPRSCRWAPGSTGTGRAASSWLPGGGGARAAARSRWRQFAGLLAARVLCGVGVSACLMAPLTGYRRWLSRRRSCAPTPGC